MRQQLIVKIDRLDSEMLFSESNFSPESDGVVYLEGLHGEKIVAPQEELSGKYGGRLEIILFRDIRVRSWSKKMSTFSPIRVILSSSTNLKIRKFESFRALVPLLILTR